MFHAAPAAFPPATSEKIKPVAKKVAVTKKEEPSKREAVWNDAPSGYENAEKSNEQSGKKYSIMDDVKEVVVPKKNVAATYNATKYVEPAEEIPEYVEIEARYPCSICQRKFADESRLVISFKLKIISGKTHCRM